MTLARLTALAWISVGAVVVAGCGGEDSGTPSPSPSGPQFVRCESPAGFALARPQGWHANSGDVAPRCSRLDPDPIELREGTDARTAAIAASIEDVAFARAAAPRGSQTARAVTAIDGLQAMRLELETSGRGLWPEGTPLTQYLVDLGPEAGTLIVDTVGLDGFDYERNQRVLDEVARRLEITRDGVETAPRVVARYVGGGAFRVAGRLRGDRACLRIAPRGAERCADVPAPAAARTVRLPERPPILAGVTGRDVFSVTAERRDGEPFTVLPAPIGGGSTRGFALPFGPDGVERLRLAGVDGEPLGTVEVGADGGLRRPRGTGPRSGSGSATARDPARLEGVRTGRHPRFDRVVLDFAPGSGVPAYRVAYADRPLNRPGSGPPVTIAGDRVLHVRLRNVAATEPLGHEGAVRPGHPAIPHVEDLGTFEGMRSLGIGLNADGPRPDFRVQALEHRLVVDIARPGGDRGSA